LSVVLVVALRSAERCGQSSPEIRLARLSISSSIAGVSRPVKVFYWQITACRPAVAN
jgi:hypothetical protein